jgi:hypothetical protein
MLLNLLAQTWRSVAAVAIAWGLIIWSILYNPEALLYVIQNARSAREWLLDFVENRTFDNATVDILAGTMITDHTVTMAMLFLFARIVVLTLVLFVVGSIWKMLTGHEPAFAH